MGPQATRDEGPERGSIGWHPLRKPADWRWPLVRPGANRWATDPYPSTDPYPFAPHWA